MTGYVPVAKRCRKTGLTRAQFDMLGEVMMGTYPVDRTLPGNTGVMRSLRQRGLIDARERITEEGLAVLDCYTLPRYRLPP